MNRLTLWHAQAAAWWLAFEHRTQRQMLEWAHGCRRDAIKEMEQSELGLKCAQAREQRACAESELAYQRVRKARIHAEWGIS